MMLEIIVWCLTVLGIVNIIAGIYFAISDNFIGSYFTCFNVLVIAMLLSLKGFSGV